MGTLIDADEIVYEETLRCAGRTGNTSTYYHDYHVWRRDIDKMPAVDAVPVIRCKDCKFAHLIEPGNDWWECEHDKRVLHSDGFCSWAERKEK